MPLPGGRRDPATRADGRRRGRVRACGGREARQERPASLAPRRQPDVRQGDAHGHHPDGRDHQDRRQRVAHQSRSLARAARVADARGRVTGTRGEGGRGRPARTVTAATSAARTASAPRTRVRRPHRPPPSRCRRRGDDAACRAGPRPPGSCPRGRTASRRIASSGSSVVTMSGRPRPARRTAPRSASRTGTPQAIAWSTAAQLLDAQPDGRRRRRALGHRSGIVGRGPLGLAGARRPGPSSMASTSIAIRSSPSHDLERHRLAAVLEWPSIACRRRSRAGCGGTRAAGGLVLELLLGVDPAGDAPRTASCPPRRARAREPRARPGSRRGCGRRGRRRRAIAGGSSRSRAARGQPGPGGRGSRRR